MGTHGRVLSGTAQSTSDVAWHENLGPSAHNTASPPDYQDTGDANGWSTWCLSGRQGTYKGDRRIHAGRGDGSYTATWTLTGLAAGYYEVLATWTSASGRASNAPYKVFDGTASAGTLRLDVAMNRRLEANDATCDGHRWELLGLAEVTAGTLTVQLSDNGADGKVVADAISVKQHAGAEGTASSGGSVALAKMDLRPMVAATLADWVSLDSVTVPVDQSQFAGSAITELLGTRLGRPDWGTAQFDRDATAAGRLVDPVSDGNGGSKSPGSDGGLDPIVPEAVDRIDLSTVVSYEPRPLARVEDLDSLVLGLLSDHWDNGERRESKKSEAETIFADEDLLAAMLAER